ncbi:MAG TPA: peptidyl-prolyl cis-trans isomerase [Xanthomonadales bacterium]|nr:peptidyl-prolyl cis-trans isomerase [Xanthomonadales bacterium]
MTQLPEESRRRQSLLLAIAALLGLAMAITGLVKPGGASSVIPADVVANIDGRQISLGRYEALLEDMASDSREPLTAADREFALDRLIDEELLVLHGIELGLDQSEPGVRKAIAAALIASIANQAETVEIKEPVLRGFFESNQEFFTRDQQRVIHWYGGKIAEYSDPVADDQFITGSYENKKEKLNESGLERVSILPDQPLNFAKTRDYLGNELAIEAFALQSEEWSEPIRSNGQIHVLFVASVLPGITPAFNDIRALVEAEYRRRQGEDALRSYLDALRAGRDIQVQEGLVESL